MRLLTLIAALLLATAAAHAPAHEQPGAPNTKADGGTNGMDHIKARNRVIAANTPSARRDALRRSTPAPRSRSITSLSLSSDGPR